MNPKKLGFAVIVMVAAGLACSLPGDAGGSDEVATSVAGTLTAEAPPGATDTPQGAEATSTNTTGTEAPTAAAVTATNTAPPQGISLNCDGTYQRVRIVDEGINGKSVAVDNWNGTDWDNVWIVSSGDPNIRQILDEAGYYQFGDCQKLVIVPMRHSNPHVFFELGIYVWNGAGMSQVYFYDGAYGEWSKSGATVTFQFANQLGWVDGGPLGPCDTTTLEHTWDGVMFNQTGSNIVPVPNCVPSN
jgi:hypothetical protein